MRTLHKTMCCVFQYENNHHDLAYVLYRDLWLLIDYIFNIKQTIFILTGFLHKVFYL